MPSPDQSQRSFKPTLDGITEAVDAVLNMPLPHGYQDHWNELDRAFDGGDAQLSMTVAAHLVRSAAEHLLTEEVDGRNLSSGFKDRERLDDVLDQVDRLAVSDKSPSFERMMAACHEVDFPITQSLLGRAYNRRPSKMAEAHFQRHMANSALKGTGDEGRLRTKLATDLVRLRTLGPNAAEKVVSDTETALYTYLDGDGGPEQLAELRQSLSKAASQFAINRALVDGANRRELEILCLAEDCDEVFPKIASAALDHLENTSSTPSTPPSLETTVAHCEWALAHAHAMFVSAKLARTGAEQKGTPSVAPLLYEPYAQRAYNDPILASRGTHSHGQFSTILESVMANDESIRERLLQVARTSDASGQTLAEANTDIRSIAGQAAQEDIEENAGSEWQAVRERTTLVVHELAKKVPLERLMKTVSLDPDCNKGFGATRADRRQSHQMDKGVQIGWTGWSSEASFEDVPVRDREVTLSAQRGEAMSRTATSGR